MKEKGDSRHPHQLKLIHAVSSGPYRHFHLRTNHAPVIKTQKFGFGKQKIPTRDALKLTPWASGFSPGASPVGCMESPMTFSDGVSGK